jgi:hypothetical protein
MSSLTSTQRYRDRTDLPLALSVAHVAEEIHDVRVQKALQDEQAKKERLYW